MTKQEISEATRAAQAAAKYGDGNPNVRYSDAQVRELHALWKSGKRLRELARHLGGKAEHSTVRYLLRVRAKRLGLEPMP